MAPDTLDQARERLRPYVERAQGFSGWMAYVENRPLGPGHPWDYLGRARELITDTDSVLDLGTGGGERFGQLCQDHAGRAVATEEWQVNAPVAAARLRPLGVGVVRCLSVEPPFAAESFDLVLDRHEELSPAEVARILRPGGTVLTQQVFNHWKELVRFFPRMTDFGDHFHGYQGGGSAPPVSGSSRRRRTKFSRPTKG